MTTEEKQHQASLKINCLVATANVGTLFEDVSILFRNNKKIIIRLAINNHANI